MENAYYKSATRRASSILKDKTRLRKLLVNVGSKLNSGSLEVAKVTDRIKLLVRMVMAYKGGEYRVVPWKSIMIITAVLVYFVMPLDVIADFIPVTGYIDDLALVLWAFNHLDADIQAFTDWESSQSESI